MAKSCIDSCMVIRKETKGMKGVIILQFDDSFALGNTKFTNGEEIESNEFLVKPQKFLSEQPKTFHGIRLTRDKSRTIATTQHSKMEKLSVPTIKAENSNIRALAQYIGVNSRLKSAHQYS